MRYIRIFLLNFQYVFERRAVSMVWFLVSIFNPLLLLLYWRGVLHDTSMEGWTLSSISSYYFLLVIAGSMLMSHIEDGVANEDIEQGNLVRYLIKPFSYYWISFFAEIPYRLLQGSFGIIVFAILLIFFENFITITNDPVLLALTAGAAVLAFFLSFTYKMVLGMSAFWLVDSGGFFQMMEIIVIVFAGFILPLDLMPPGFEKVAQMLPFAYIVYYPVTLLQGKLALPEALMVLGMQCFWIVIFSVIYKIVWNTGIKRFTGMGQ